MKNEIMKLTLNYGKTAIAVDFPTHVDLLQVNEPDFDIDKEKFCNVFAKNLPSNGYDFRKVGIVVSDKTRLCGYPEYLPWVTEILIKQGAQKENITFYIAYGAHFKQTEEECFSTYGETFSQYRFVHHDCREEKGFMKLGTTSQGTPVIIRKDILESSLLITFGAISHHYFAAYGGGRKLLFPGLASREAIYHNHGLFLDRKQKKLSEGCQPGNLEGNPLAEDLKEIDGYMPPKVSIHGILNSKGKVCRLLIGKTYGDFITACLMHDSYYRSGDNKEYDIVMASSGGYPKDINFIQAHKSLHHAAAFVKNGGKLVLLAECIDGIGSEYFLKYLEAGTFEKAFALLEKDYEGNGGTALSMMTKTKRIKVYMMTSLSDQICATLNVTKIETGDIQRMILQEHSSIAIIQNASLLVK
jgi:nickel-dependent lactate racemase